MARSSSVTKGILKAGLSIGLIALLVSWGDAARMWSIALRADPVWLLAAIAAYAAMIGVSAWRWGVLLAAQQIRVPLPALGRSFLVATFFNNFLPGNIGGDVVRIADTAGAAGSRTLATTVVLIDRGLGVLALGLVAAAGATVATAGVPIRAPLLWGCVAAVAAVAVPLVMKPLAVARLLSPLRALQRLPRIPRQDWVDERLARLTAALERFRDRPFALGAGLAGAVIVQVLLVLFYVAIAVSLSVPIAASQLAVIVPASFIVQMLPVSVNGLGVREATFGFYFAQLGLPLESGVLLSLAGAALVLPFSLAGSAIYASRRRAGQRLDSPLSPVYSGHTGNTAPQTIELP